MADEPIPQTPKPAEPVVTPPTPHEPLVTPPTPPAPSAVTVEPKRKRRGFNPWRLFFGLCIIFIGLALLAKQLGWDWVDPNIVWKFWPVLIIFIGLSLLTRGGVVTTTISILIGLALIIGMIAVSATSTVPTSTKDISVTREAAATSAVVRFDVGGAKVVLDGGSAALVTGSFSTKGGNIRTGTSLEETKQVATIVTEHVGSWWGGWHNEITGHLSSIIPVDLEVHSGASELQLDLRSVKANSVAVSTGAASLNLQLGDDVDHALVSINAGASSIELTIPSSLGVRLNLDAAAASTELGGLVKISDHLYESSNYSSAEKNVQVTIHAGASSVTLHH